MGDLAPVDESDGEAPSTNGLDAEAAIREILSARLPFPVARVKLLEELQKAYVERALAEHDGSVEQAAKALGIGRRYFHILRTGKRKR
jgi:DNA-binding NtrC family response regulator